MPHSHHSHSGQFCRHAKDTLEEIVLEAIRQGFEVYGLTEHAPRWRVEDLFPEEADLSPTDLLRAYEVFLYEAARLREKHADRISLLIGLETDYITPLDLGNTTRLVADHQEIDCLVGSVHHVNGVSIDFDRSTWLRAVRTVNLGLIRTTMVASSSGQPVLAPSDPDDPHLQPGYTPTIPELRSFLLAYFDWQYELLRNHRPEVIGHFDLCLLWTPSVSLRSEDFEGVWEKVERNVRYIVEYGGLFEANVAALRKGWETSYPGRGVLELIHRLGGRVCLSDDSHGVSQVGLNYLRMRVYLSSMGVEEIWYLVPIERRQNGDQVIGTRGRVVARRLEGDWRTYPFWSRIAAAQAYNRA